jgi:hypothetical protein
MFLLRIEVFARLHGTLIPTSSSPFEAGLPDMDKAQR